jgi:hypothetical protein
MDKYYYIVFWSPVQTLAVYYKGKYPLKPKVLQELQTKIAIKLSIVNNLTIPRDAVAVTNVIELDAETAAEVTDLKLVKSLDTL